MTAVCLALVVAGCGATAPTASPRQPAALPSPSHTTFATPAPRTPSPPSAWTQTHAAAFTLPGAAVYGLERLPLGDLVLGSIDDHAAIWLRRQGGDWSLPAIRGSEGSSRAVSAAGSPDRVVVAVRDEEGEGSELWLIDALGERKVVMNDAFPDGWIVRDIEWTGTDFVAVGAASAENSTVTIEGSEAAIWSSPDGETWDRIDLRGAVAGSMLLSVAAREGAVLAGGQLATGTIDGLLVRRSEDGWRAVDAAGLAGDQDETVLRVLATPSGWDIRGVVTPPECAASGCITSLARVWTSLDGDTWDVRDLERDEPIPFGSTADGLVAIAFDEGTGTLRIVSSPDGSTWEDATDALSLPANVNVAAWSTSATGFMVAGANANGEITLMEWR